MSSTYRIETIDDILRVPVDSRAALFRDLETALLTHELVYGEAAEANSIGSLLWTDDGDNCVTIEAMDGETVATLQVTVTEGGDKP